MTISDPSRRNNSGMPVGNPGAWPRYLNAAIAVWLFISAFLWTHTDVQRTNTWIVAVLMFCAALFALGAPMVRFVNAALAAWLFFSTLFMRSFPATVWNNLIVAIVVFVLALVPTTGTSTSNRPSRSHPAST